MIKLFISLELKLRTLIFVLTLLIALQPVSWAASSGVYSQGNDQGDTASSSPASSGLPASPELIKNSGSDFNPPSHAKCINTMDSMADDATVDCFVNCLTDCTATACLETSTTTLISSVSFDAYLVPSMHSYASLYASPEIQPPRV